MRIVFVVALLLCGFAGYLWYLGGRPAAPVAAEPAPAVESSEEAVPSSTETEAGVYYLTERVTASTREGMKTFPAGSGWTLTGESGTSLLLAADGNIITVSRAKTTRDPAVARAAADSASPGPSAFAPGSSWEEEQAAYQQKRHALEEKIRTAQDLIANEQTKIRAAKGEGGGTLRADVKNLSHGAKHTIQVAEERIEGFRSEITALKKEMSLLVAPAAPREAPVVAPVDGEPALEKVVEAEKASMGFAERIVLGFQRITGKN